MTDSTTEVDENSELTPIETGTVLRDTEEERTVVVTDLTRGTMTVVEIESPAAAEGLEPAPYDGPEETFRPMMEGRRFALTE